ncbi:MAG: hypothetical protein R3D00_18105 [Bacteroidia bacterium]
MEFFEIIEKIVEPISIIIASIVAIWGILSWKREAAWRKENEVAEETLCLLYDIKDRIRRIRNPSSIGPEGSSRTKEEGESIDESNAQDAYFVIKERYNKEQEAFNLISSKKYKFAAIFGKEYLTVLADIDSIINSIFTAYYIIHIAEFERKKHRIKYIPEREEDRIKEIEKWYSLIYFDPTKETDEIENRVNSNIVKIENVCKKFLLN